MKILCQLQHSAATIQGLTRRKKRGASVSLLGDIDFDFGDGRSKEDFLFLRVGLLELFAVDVHVELQLDVLRSFDLAQQLHDRFVGPDFFDAKEVGADARRAGHRVARFVQLQVELEAAEARQRPAHREEVGGNTDVAGKRDEVDGVGKRRVEAFLVSLRTHERASLTSDVAASRRDGQKRAGD